MGTRIASIHQKRMRDPDTSGLDSHSSDSEEESVEHRDNLGNQFRDFSGHQSVLDGASLVEKKLPADLADLGRALFLEDKEKRFKRLYGARHVQGDAEHSRVSVLGDSDHTVETCNNLLEKSVPENCAIDECVLWEREEHGQFGREEERKVQLIREQIAQERCEIESREAENLPQQLEAITGRSQWLCEHYQRHCRVRFTCCTQFYPCHRCHNISEACDNEEAKACHATHLKCSHCQEEQEIGEDSAKCRKCGGKMSVYFCAICKHFASVDKNPYHCEKCGICRIHQDKSFHCEVCKVCLDKRLERSHKCRPDSGHNECCICLEDAFSGCQILPFSHEFHRECANVAVTQSGIEDHNRGLCLCERCTSFGEDKGVSPELPIMYAACSNSSTQSWADIDDSSAQSQTSYTDVSLKHFSGSKSVSWSDCSANSQIAPEADSYAPDEGCVEREDYLRNHLEDLLHNSCLQTSLDGSNLVEKKSVPADLENPEGTLFLTDKEKRFMQHYGALLQGNELGNTMSDGVLAGASSPSTSSFEPHLGDFEHSRVSVLHNSDHKSSDNSLLALERCVAETCALVERVLQEREEHEQSGREIEAEQLLTGEQRARGGEEREERELGCIWREGASVALTQNGIEYHNHGLCLCKRCTLSREDEDKEVSPALPIFADSSSSTQSQVATDDNCAQSQSSSTDAALETLSGLKGASMSDFSSANSQIALEADSIYDEESQHILYAPLPEGIAPSFLARHTQDRDLYERGLLEMSLLNNIPSHHLSSSNLGLVPDFVFGSQRVNPLFSDDWQTDTNLQGSLESFLSVRSSGQRERQGMDEGSWAGAVRPHLGFPVLETVGGSFNGPLAQRNAAFSEDCSTTVLEEEAGFGDDISVQSPADGARPRQPFTSANSQSCQFWNHTGARPRETQGRRFSVTPHQPIEDESLLFDGGREGTEEDCEDGITMAFLLKHSQDETLCTWAFHEHALVEEGVEQLGTRIEWKEKLIREKRACKEEEEEKELQEMSNIQVHTAHKVPVQACDYCNEIIDAQHQESHPCHHHPDICCICQEYLDAFIGCYEVPCGHKFHEECYLNMLRSNIETCPLCR